MTPRMIILVRMICFKYHLPDTTGTNSKVPMSCSQFGLPIDLPFIRSPNLQIHVQTVRIFSSHRTVMSTSEMLKHCHTRGL